MRRNHHRHGQCPGCSGPEPLHLQPRKHISVNILAARHMRQKQIHVPLGKEKEKPAHKRHVGALTHARRPAPPACCPCAGESVCHAIPRPSNGRRPPQQTTPVQ